MQAKLWTWIERTPHPEPVVGKPVVGTVLRKWELTCWHGRYTTVRVEDADQRGVIRFSRVELENLVAGLGDACGCDCGGYLLSRHRAGAGE